MAMIAPSILGADFGAMRSEVQEVVAGGCELLHVDVMDGHFVPNITMGPDMVRMLHAAVDIPLDVHLMIEQPEQYLETFYEAGLRREGSILTVHYEACPHIHRVLEQIHRLGGAQGPKVQAGVAINPGTPVSALESVLEAADMVLIMSVDPGFGGQAAIESCLQKVAQVRDLAEKVNKQGLRIEVDGGIKLDNLDRVKDADILVMGSAIFNAEGAGTNMRRAKERLAELV